MIYVFTQKNRARSSKLQIFFPLKRLEEHVLCRFHAIDSFDFESMIEEKLSFLIPEHADGLVTFLYTVKPWINIDFALTGVNLV